MPQDLIGCRKRRKLKALIPLVVVFVNDPPSAKRRLILLSFLLFDGLMVGKYALTCTMEIQKIHMVVHIFSGFALFKETVSFVLPRVRINIRTPGKAKLTGFPGDLTLSVLLYF